MIDKDAKANALSFISSKTMREYLDNLELSETQLINIILGAPASLNQKLFVLSRFFNTEENYSLINLLIEGIDNWERRLEDKEVFVLKYCWFDHDELIEKKYLHGIFKNRDKIHESLAKEYKECDDDNSSLYGWYEVQRWVCDREGTFNKKYSYVIIRHEACFFTKYEKRKDGFVLPLHNPSLTDFTSSFPPFPFDDRLSGSSNLNLPIPFKVGDLIKIDCLPFMEPKPAVIVELLDNYDCCGVQIICINEDGKYVCSPLKHSHMFIGNYTSILSPLYRLDYYKEDFEYKNILIGKAERIIGDIKYE